MAKGASHRAGAMELCRAGPPRKWRDPPKAVVGRASQTTLTHPTKLLMRTAALLDGLSLRPLPLRPGEPGREELGYGGIPRHEPDVLVQAQRGRSRRSGR